MKITDKKLQLNTKHIRKIFLAMLALSVILYSFFIGSAVHSPSSSALEAMQSDTQTTVSNTKDYIRFSSNGKEGTAKGFLLYPHDKIDPQAYASLAKAIHQQFDADVYVIKYPMNYFWLGSTKGKKIANQSNISTWHVIMHGNGGLFRQTSYPTNTSSMIYLSSYPLFKLNTDDEVMVVRGTLDGVNPDKKWLKKRKLFPKNSIEYEIPQGNFSYFADFGLLENDFAGMLSINEQLELTLDYLEDFINGL